MGVKLILYEWRCRSCDTKFDEMTYSDVRTCECPECGGEADRLLSAGHIDPRLGIDPAFATMRDKWARTQEQHAREAYRRRAETGDEI